MQNETDARKMRGLQIAKTCRINKNEKGWIAPSQSGLGKYLVTSDGFEPQCTCPDYENRRQKCKHVFAVEFTINKVRSKTDVAQVNEILLKVLCHNICVVIQEMHELGIKPEFYKNM